jgi:exodeoxyribonuclease V alpha subunit
MSHTISHTINHHMDKTMTGCAEQLLHCAKPMPELLKRWEREGLLTPLDRHFALEMARCHHEDSPLFLLICALLSRQLSSQHACLVLSHIDYANPLQETHSQCVIRLSAHELEERLARMSAVQCLSGDNSGEKGGDNSADKSTDQSSYKSADAPELRPLVLENGRLYLQRYHQFETQVAWAIKGLAQRTIPLDEPRVSAQLDLLFPKTAAAAEPDWQKIATATALTKAFTLITGGPGTGKTTTVTKLLLLLQLQRTQAQHHADGQQGKALDIRLVAPTGKAAARLSESIKASKARLAAELAPRGDSQLLAALELIPEQASTLHRLLGVIPNSHKFRHHRDNPLHLDLLIVDEASMVDLPMMHKLLSALPEHARLILLGDQDQLASVEAGAVLADICAGLKVRRSQEEQGKGASLWQMRYSQEQAQRLERLTGAQLQAFIHPSPMLGDNLSMLMHSHRFKGDAGIGLLAGAVNRADLTQILHTWQQGHSELHWLEHAAAPSAKAGTQQPPQTKLAINAGLRALLAQAVDAYRPYLELIARHQQALLSLQSDYEPEAIIDSFNQYRLLCAMRGGDYGVEGSNQAVTQALAGAKLIEPAQEFYLGRPVIIQCNDYNLGLFNGDIGLVLQDKDKPQRLMAHFIRADGSILKVLPARLPSHETCYAMTVHKSQGSEFARVALVLPTAPSPSQWQLLTKELVYTAITRAKQQFTCLGSQSVFERAVSQSTQRASGLAHRLWAD